MRQHFAHELLQKQVMFLVPSVDIHEKIAISAGIEQEEYFDPIFKISNRPSLIYKCRGHNVEFKTPYAPKSRETFSVVTPFPCAL